MCQMLARAAFRQKKKIKIQGYILGWSLLLSVSCDEQLISSLPSFSVDKPVYGYFWLETNQWQGKGNCFISHCKVWWDTWQPVFYSDIFMQKHSWFLHLFWHLTWMLVVICNLVVLIWSHWCWRRIVLYCYQINITIPKQLEEEEFFRALHSIQVLHRYIKHCFSSQMLEWNVSFWGFSYWRRDA